MTFRFTATLACLALLATACRSASTTSTAVTGTPVLQIVPAPFNPAGKWSLGLVAQGQSLEVVMELAKLPDGSWVGALSSAAFPPIQSTKATLNGKQLLLSFPVPTGDTGSMTLTFDGDLVEGEWSMPGDGSKVSGKKM